MIIASYPELVNWAPNMAPMSGREPPYVAAAANWAGAPFTLKAQTCTAHMPGPEAAPRSIAQPPTKKPLAGTVAPAPGVSTDSAGALKAVTVTTTLRAALNVLVTVLCR